MTTPSAQAARLRTLAEISTRRRLAIAELLRENPATTNIELANKLGVSRNTITSDRRAIMEQLQNQTLKTSEQMRAEMLQRLEELTEEVEAHRKDGKLSLAAVDRLLDISKAIVDLTGCRRAVVEKVEIKKKTISFVTKIGLPGQYTEQLCTLENKQLALGEATDE